MTVNAGQKVTASLVNSLAGMACAGGQVRVTNASATSGTTEVVWATTPSLSLAASTWYEVVVKCYWIGSVSSDQYSVRVRDTNVTGTIRNGVVAPPSQGGGPYPTEVVYTFETGSAANYTFCATVVRSSGTGTATVQAQSRILVNQIGPATLNISTA
jgi:hypothetical protein